MSFPTTFIASNPSRIIQIIPAEHGWYAHYKDSERLPVICWALIDNGGLGMVIGLVALRHNESLSPASFQPDFIVYAQS